jgi:succinate dehydrogenase hydrophobic anchor subunit
MQANRSSTASSQQHPRNALFLAVRVTAVAALAFVAGMTFTAGPAAAAQSDGDGGGRHLGRIEAVA